MWYTATLSWHVGPVRILWLFCSHGSICLAVNKLRSHSTVTKCHTPYLTSGITLTLSSSKTQSWARCCYDGLFMSSLSCHLVYLFLYFCVFFFCCRLLPLSWAQPQPYSSGKPVVGLCWKQGSTSTKHFKELQMHPKHWFSERQQN